MTRLVPTRNLWIMQYSTWLKTVVWLGQISSPIYVCIPLSVVSNAVGKLRLMTFKYEDLHIAALKFDKDEYLFKFDLK